MNTPSTGTSSGSVRTKEPAAQRAKLDNSVACSVSVPRSTAGLVVDCRRLSRQQEQQDAGCGGPAVPGSSASGADQNFDDLPADDLDSEPEAVGSTSSGEWRPLPREATLEGPSLTDFLKGRSGILKGGPSVPGHHPAAGDGPPTVEDLPTPTSRGGRVEGSLGCSVVPDPKVDTLQNNEDEQRAEVFLDP